MAHHRWHWLPIGLVALAVVAVCAATIRNHAALGWWQAMIYVGCLSAAAAAAFFRRKLTNVEIELDRLRQKLTEDESRLASERSQFEELRLAMQEELTQQASRLDKREQALADRLVTYHEWMEFPQPIELAHPPPPSEALSDLARKDRQMLQLLQDETRTLYDNILQNKYAADGQVLLPVIRDDVVRLITRVAQIYQPTVQQPLLE